MFILIVIIVFVLFLFLWYCAACRIAKWLFADHKIFVIFRFVLFIQCVPNFFFMYVLLSSSHQTIYLCCVVDRGYSCHIGNVLLCDYRLLLHTYTPHIHTHVGVHQGDGVIIALVLIVIIIVFCHPLNTTATNHMQIGKKLNLCLLWRTMELHVIAVQIPKGSCRIVAMVFSTKFIISSTSIFDIEL